MMLWTPKYWSPTAIETWIDCPRKLAWEWVDGLKRTSSDSAELGDRIHKMHEARYRDGVPYDLTKFEGRVAQATEHLLPPVGMPGLKIEDKLTVSFEGFTFGGKMDLRWTAQPDDRVVSVVLDHKTGNLSYAKDTREKLLGHPQAPIYAVAATHADDTSIADLRWCYASTKHKRKIPIKKSWHFVERAEAEDILGRKYVPIVREMARLLPIVKTALELPPNALVCDKYGGCPRKANCNLTDRERQESIRRNRPMSNEKPAGVSGFLAKMKAKQAGGVAAPAAEGVATSVPQHSGHSVNPPESKDAKSNEEVAAEIAAGKGEAGVSAETPEPTTEAAPAKRGRKPAAKPETPAQQAETLATSSGAVRDAAERLVTLELIRILVPVHGATPTLAKEIKAFCAALYS
jgi:hypothetical protein